MQTERRAFRGMPLMLIAAAACASAGAPPLDDAPPDAAIEASAIRTAVQTQRLEVLFDWTMQDRDARFSGRGLLRLDRDERARVDLYGSRGETVAAAVLEGNAMRVVPQSAASLLPPPALLWSVLGSFRPPQAASLTGTRAAAGSIDLVYQGGMETWRFGFQQGRLRTTEWTEGGRRRTVTLSGSAAADLPEQARFRDWTEFRELTLSVTDVEERTAFEDDVWTLPGER